MNTFRCKNANWLCSIAFVLLTMLLFSSSVYASDIRHLWQSREQFVALERQDNGATSPAKPNDHPTELSLERLAAILASIDMRTNDGSKPEPLLTEPALQVLVPQLQQALHQASPGEDVTFAIIGLHDTLYGLAKSPKVTTGRVFYKAGRLNIIFGLAQQEVRDRDDRRLFPFTPGSRQKAMEGEWTLMVHTSQNGYNQVRKDWVSFSDEWQVPTAQTVAEKSAPMQQTTPGKTGKPYIDTRTHAERLVTLNELKNKGLISAEEYHAKRLEILNSL